MKYVVYITMYSGIKMPTWYIGSSYENRILNGYNGSVASKKYKEIYMDEQQNNKDLFRTKILSYHKTKKNALLEELRLQKMHSVVKNDKYFNQSYAKKNGFEGGDNSTFIDYKLRSINNPISGFSGKTHTQEVRENISNNNKLRTKENNPQFGKSWIYNLELKESKILPRNEIQYYLDNGWMKGRKQNF